MAQEPSARSATDQGPGLSRAAVYQICVQGCLDDHWAGWLGGITLARDVAHHTTTLTSVVPDQAALHGILARIRDLGLPLLSLTYVANQQSPGSGDAETGSPAHS